MVNCFICNNAANLNNSNIHEPQYDCSVCGEYSITDIAMNTIPRDRYPDWAHRLQRFVQENQVTGRVIITDHSIKSLFGF